MTTQRLTRFRTDVVRSMLGRPSQETPRRRPRAHTARGLVLALVLLGVGAAAPPADAGTVTNHPGSICRESEPGLQPGKLQYVERGLQNKSTASINIHCPLIRRTTNSNGTTVYVDVNHVTDYSTTTCCFYSYQYTGLQFGGYLGTCGSTSGMGVKDLLLSRVGANLSDTWSDYNMWCSLAGGALLLGVDLNEAD